MTIVLRTIRIRKIQNHFFIIITLLECHKLAKYFDVLKLCLIYWCTWVMPDIFFRGCVPEMFVTSYPVTYCVNVPGKPRICFHYHCAVYECKYSDTFWLASTRLFVQYTIALSALCKLIWGHWIDKMPVRYILSSVWVRLSIFSPLSIIQYVGL